MNFEPEPPKYNEEDLKKACRVLQDEGLTFVAQAKEAGIAYGSFTNWIAGTYAADTTRIMGQVSQWLAARVERAAVVASIPTAPPYVDTPTARRITSLFTFAQSSPDIVVVAAGPGVGKTTAATEYQRTGANVFLVTARTSLKGAHNILLEIAIVLGVEERLGSRLNRAIGTKLKGRRALIIVDEAQHLSPEALDEVRSLHDLWDCGIALIGAPSVYTKIEGKSRDGNLAQLFSRIGMRMTQARPRPEDVTALAGAWGIVDPKVMRLVQKIAARPGALRVLTKTLKLASIVAAGDGGNALSEEAITKAFNQLGDALVS
jgi:DNA transposition AAA+ family ATPase